MSGFCLSYIKYIFLAGFILLGIFALLIGLDVETIKIQPNKKDNAIWITGITAGVNFLFIINNNYEKNFNF